MATGGMKAAKSHEDSNAAMQIKYELNEVEVLQIYYEEPRLGILMDLEVIKWVEGHLVVNLNEFITPKTNKLTKYAKQNIPACCIGIKQADEKKISTGSTLDILLQAAGFLESGNKYDSNQSIEYNGKADNKSRRNDVRYV